MSGLGSAAAGAGSAAGAAASAGVRVSIDGGAWLSWSRMPASQVQAMSLGEVLGELSIHPTYTDAFRGVNIGHCKVYALLDKAGTRDETSALTDDTTVGIVLGKGQQASPIFLAVELPAAARACASLSPCCAPPLEPDVVSTVLPPLSCSASLLQALEVLPRLEQVRLSSRVSPLCCMSALPRVRRDTQASPDVHSCVDTTATRLSAAAAGVLAWCEGFGGFAAACSRLALPSLPPRCPS